MIGKPGKTTLPPPFDQVPIPPGHEIHDKFVVCGLNGTDPVVYCGSSNLATGGEQANGDNLLEIHDADVATAFAVEALLLVDHYNFLDRYANPKAPRAAPKSATKKAPAAKKTASVSANRKAPAKAGARKPLAKAAAKKIVARKTPGKTAAKKAAVKTPARRGRAKPGTRPKAAKTAKATQGRR